MSASSFASGSLAPLMGLAFLLIVLNKNEAISRGERTLFYLLWLLELLELLAYDLELVTASWDHPTRLRILLSAVGYSLRPAMAMLMLRLVCSHGCTGWRRIVLLGPLVLAVLCAFSAFFSDIAYSYDSANQFHRGPLGYFSQVITTFYIVMFSIRVLKEQLLESRKKFTIMLLILIYLISAMALEAALNLRSIGRTAIVFSTIFFLSALQTNKLETTIHALRENEDLKAALAKVEAAQRELTFSRSVMQALGEDYMTVLYADLDRNEIRAEKLEEGYNYAAVLTSGQEHPSYDSVLEAYSRIIVAPQDQERYLSQFRRDALRHTIQSEKSLTIRYSCHIGDGPEFCVESRVIPMELDASGGGVIIAMRNVEDQVQRERAQYEAMSQALEAARQANAAKSAFLSRMSHDIRTPLNGIIGILEIGERHKDDVELLNRNREKAKIAANHLLSLINDVLDMSKLEDGNTVLSHETICIPKLVEDIMTIAEMRASEAGVTLYCDENQAAFACPYVYGSPLHLRQIFLNILGNAVKYNKPGGSIHCSLEYLGLDRDRAVYRVTIRDTGIGMSEEFLPHLFEPFTQEHTDARSVYQGTGLGMAIVKGLVEKMGGTIRVSSKVDEGTTFVVVLPFEISDESRLPSTGSDVPADIRGVRILLVEDNALNMEIAATLLEESGAVITPVTDGKQAVAAFADNPPDTFDAILTDIMMPVMDGLTAARTIRSLPRQDAASIPIIAMTANAFVEDIHASIDAGMNAHLAKPLDMTQVIATIARLTHPRQ